MADEPLVALVASVSVGIGVESWGRRVQGTGDFPKALAPGFSSMEWADGPKKEKGEKMPPCPIMHALLSL